MLSEKSSFPIRANAWSLNEMVTHRAVGPQANP